MKLIVGLGNPGSEYALARHNIGFIVLDHYLTGKQFKLETKLNCYLYKEKDAIFIKPTTYMNLSGDAVIKVKNYYKCDEVLVISDDLDLALGKIRLKSNGSAGGHNGLKSVISVLGQDFYRLKIGISRPLDNDIIKHVLAKFSASELEVINSILPTISAIISDFLKDVSFRTLQNKYN